MTFSEFIQKLYIRCGNGYTQPNFLRTLLSKITDAPKDSFFGEDDNYVNKFFNGARPFPRKIASYILTHLEKGKFDTYLYDLLAEDALMELCNDFEPIVGNASTGDITEKISNLFVSILKAIATKKEPATAVFSVELSNFAIERDLTEIVKSLSSLPPEKRKINLTYEPYKHILPVYQNLPLINWPHTRDGV